jgi:hypothetical protein
MKYEIIEDCSPYYIRFTYEGLTEFNLYALDIYDNYDWSGRGRTMNPKFIHLPLDGFTGQKVLDHTILSKDIEFNSDRVSYFKSHPGLYYRAHKDGINHRFSINHTIKILDDKCITNWYADYDLTEYQMDQFLLNRKSSRECVDFIKENHTPLKSMIAKPNECILFNTDIFHDWDNRTSTNERVVLTLRSTTPGNIYFNDAKQLLFKGKI